VAWENRRVLNLGDLFPSTRRLALTPNLTCTKSRINDSQPIRLAAAVRCVKVRSPHNRLLGSNCWSDRLFC
jgi:hypothetical protein